MPNHHGKSPRRLPPWDGGAPLRARLATRSPRPGTSFVVFTRDQNGTEADTSLWLNLDRTAATAEERVAMLDELLNAHGYRRMSRVKGGYRTPNTTRWSLECNVEKVKA